MLKVTLHHEINESVTLKYSNKKEHYSNWLKVVLT